MNSTRRNFLQRTIGTSGLLSMSGSVPHFVLQTSAQAAESKQEKILVVLQLTGGNDGLNTIVPFADEGYYRNRYTLGVPKNQVLKINDSLGFHSSMNGMAELLEENQLAVLQGIGYPNPDRSHFSSMDIWHTATREVSKQQDGWLGRYLDQHQQTGTGVKSNGSFDVPGMHLGQEKQPLALSAQHIHSPSIHSMDSFRLRVDQPKLKQTIQKVTQAERPASSDLLAFLQQSTVAALDSSEKVQAAVANHKSPVDYPNTPLGEKFKNVAQLIDAGLSTQVYYLQLDGFDTHADQQQAHANLLRQVSEALSAFMKDLTHSGNSDRVLTMTFSEFGRRVKENASRGTDHGAAAPLFLAGGKIKSGVIGQHPSLTRLDDGDLIFHTDFRQVYATILDQWLGCSSEAILGRKYPQLNLFA